MGSGGPRRGGSIAARGLGVLVVAALATACVQVGTPAPPPQFPGLPGTVEQYGGTECKTVLVAGDSITNAMAPHLDPALEASGRCATVINESLDGSSTGDWVDAIGPMLDDTSPDILVMHLLGNHGYTGPAWEDPAWLDTSIGYAQSITADALARGVHIYWVIPARSAWGCSWSEPHVQLWTAWKTWLVDTLPALYPGAVGLVDWRSPFGGEAYSQAFLFPDGARDVRLPDCVHMTSRGSRVSADATVVAIQHEWTNLPVTTTTTEPPTTTTTTTEPPTTTTTTELTTTTTEA